MRQIFSGGNGSGTIRFIRLIVLLCMFGLFYSFLWNIGYGDNRAYIMPKTWQIDKIIASIVLGSVIFIYVLFCVVLFTYLFAQAGLPAGMTYSEYARQGFSQTVFICVMNLCILGIFAKFGKMSKLLSALLCTLLALTAVMLVSGGMRLGLYIGAYGMTWLRLLSAWFIIYMAAVILLCAVRMFWKKKLPIMPICGILLVVWFIVLGYLNPDGFVGWYNYSAF